MTYINTGLANTFVLQVDPTDGKARIVNDSAFNNIRFEGYQVTSASSSLRTTWNSLQDQAITGWEETPSTTAMLAELNPTSSTNVNAGQTAAVMTGLFNTSGVQDLQFSFRVSRTPGDYNGNSNVDAADFVICAMRLAQPPTCGRTATTRARRWRNRCRGLCNLEGEFWQR